MYGVPDFYQNDNVKKGTGMQWRHQVVSDLPNIDIQPGRKVMTRFPVEYNCIYSTG